MARQGGLPPEILVRQDLDVTRYILPRRSLGKARWAGVFLLLFGGGVTAFMLAWMSGPLHGARDDAGPLQWFLVAFALLGLPGLLAGLGFLLAGLLILLNLSHAEAEISRDWIGSVERAGPLRWRRQRAVDAVERFVIVRSLRGETPDGRIVEPLGGDVVALRAEGVAMKPLWIAPGYPRSLVQALADELAVTVKTRRPGLVRERAPAVEVVEELPADETAAPEIPLPQPAGSDAVYQALEDGFTIALPAAGLWAGSKGLFFFALLWNAVCLLIGGTMLYATLFKAQQRDGGDIALIALVFSVLLAIGVAALSISISMGKRRVYLVVKGDQLAVRRLGPFKTREWKWRASDIAAVRVGPSGTEINDVPLLELQILPRQGKKVGMLSQRKDGELEWIASLLRRHLGVPARRTK